MTLETKLDGLTHYVASFINETAFQDIPVDVVALGKKSILDGLGLAFAGSVAQSAKLVRDQGGCAMLLEPKFRVRMDVASPANDLVMQVRQTVLNRHFGHPLIAVELSNRARSRVRSAKNALTR